MEPFDMTEASPDNFQGFISAQKRPIIIQALKVNLPEGFKVDTLEGTMTGEAGDYLIIGVEGERYPCKASVFEATYDNLGDVQ